MKVLPPITAEVEEHTAAIIGMLEDTRAVLDEYIHQHPGRLHHTSEEASLLCRNLLSHLHQLQDSATNHRPLECMSILADFHRDADALDTMADRIHQEGGDDRLATLLRLLAESFRFASPAILRWCFDHHGNLPVSSALARRQRFSQVLKPLARDLMVV